MYNYYNICKELLGKVAKEHTHLTIGQLRVLIIQNLGCDERTIFKYLRIMQETDLIKETLKGWELNVK